MTRFVFYFFFFQAEDGIRDYKVTGVQTCALPISLRGAWRPLPTPPKPAIRAMATAITPTITGDSSLPTRKTAAYSAQNRPLDQRLGLLASRSVITAVTARTKPTR